jgi:hypothetical protein
MQIAADRQPPYEKKKPGNVTLYTSFQRWILPELHLKKRKLLHLHARFRFSLMRNIYFFREEAAHHILSLHEKRLALLVFLPEKEMASILSLPRNPPSQVTLYAALSAKRLCLKQAKEIPKGKGVISFVWAAACFRSENATQGLSMASLCLLYQKMYPPRRRKALKENNPYSCFCTIFFPSGPVFCYL